METNTDTVYIEGLFRLQQAEFERMLKTHWQQIEDRDAHTLRAIGIAAIILLAVCGIVFWHNERIARLEHRLGAIQQQIGMEPDQNQAGAW